MRVSRLEPLDRPVASVLSEAAFFVAGSAAWAVSVVGWCLMWAGYLSTGRLTRVMPLLIDPFHIAWNVAFYAVLLLGFYGVVAAAWAAAYHKVRPLGFGKQVFLEGVLGALAWSSVWGVVALLGLIGIRQEGLAEPTVTFVVLWLFPGLVFFLASFAHSCLVYGVASRLRPGTAFVAPAAVRLGAFLFAGAVFGLYEVLSSFSL